MTSGHFYEWYHRNNLYELDVRDEDNIVIIDRGVFIFDTPKRIKLPKHIAITMAEKILSCK